MISKPSARIGRTRQTWPNVSPTSRESRGGIRPKFYLLSLVRRPKFLTAFGAFPLDVTKLTWNTESEEATEALNTKISELEESIDQLTKENEALQAQIHELGSDINKSKDAHGTAVKELEEKHSELQAEIAELTSSKKELEAAVERLQQNAKNAEEAASEAHEKEIGAKDDEIKLLQGELEQSKVTYQQEKAALEDEIKRKYSS